MANGIDYGNGMVNVDHATGIRYGVISMHEVTQAWCDSSEPFYGSPTECECGECGKDFAVNCEYGECITCPHCHEATECNLPDFQEPLGHTLNDGEYKATQGDDGDIFIVKTPYFTLCEYCSPCAPGAGYLMNEGSVKAYCFGHDWFDGGKAPYAVYSVATGEPVTA